MNIINALAISIGSLAVLATWLFFGPLNEFQMQVWQAFIAWGAFFHNGGKREGAVKTGGCMALGVVIGALSIISAGYVGSVTTLGTLAAPLVLGVGAAVFVLAAHIPLLATIPCSAYGFSCVGGLILLKGVAPVDAVIPTLASIIVGIAFAWVSEFIAERLAKIGNRKGVLTV